VQRFDKPLTNEGVAIPASGLAKVLTEAIANGTARAGRDSPCLSRHRRRRGIDGGRAGSAVGLAAFVGRPPGHPDLAAMTPTRCADAAACNGIQ